MRNQNLVGVTLAGALFLPTTLTAQVPRQPHAAELANGIRRLGVVGSVLYVAAHPDDENSRLLAWLVGSQGVRARYLSMTRGDGGQNLVGTEQDELLGLIRTHELLAARRVDGAEQAFTRARDFGYSKTADETLRIWGHDAALADVVWAIRVFRPDVVLTRFTTKPPNHGHHTASAILAEEAFAAAADPTRFPEQLSLVKTWQADRLLNNVPNFNLPPNTDMSKYLKLDVGGYDPLTGRSFGEVAAESRSQHKSQGFGVASERGPILEYFSPLAGKQAKSDIFESLDFTWRRFPGTAKILETVEAASKGYDFRAPQLSLPALAAVRDALGTLPDDNPWKAIKLREVETLMVQCVGLHLEARSVEMTGIPGGTAQVNVLAINRSTVPIKLVSASFSTGETAAVGKDLLPATPFTLPQAVALSSDAQVSTPYWLRRPPQGGLYEAPEQSWVGRPVDDPAAFVDVTLELAGRTLTVRRPVMHTWTDPVAGELVRAFEVAPDVTVTMGRDLVMFPNGKAQSVSAVVVAGAANVQGTLRLELPQGWKCDPAEAAVVLAARGDEKTVAFKLTPPKDFTQRAELHAVVEVGNRKESWRVRKVEYPHIPPLTVRQASVVKLVPVTLKTRVQHIGYIPGPGDRVAESLSAVGYDVTVLPEERLAGEKLERFDAIVVGVRAFNANPRLAVHKERLSKYVEKGGRVIVQYNTNSRVGPLTVPIGPFPLEIGRDRVTEENAELTPLDPKDPVLTTPNLLTASDYEGWVQERGLYFASKWDEHYRPVFSAHDTGEEPLKGGLLVARHGKGAFVYTGLAFFRQLPAGVPGAYRLFANILAL
jgi:LmbE family N-acetylglucosaminyl deacetylase